MEEELIVNIEETCGCRLGSMFTCTVYLPAVNLVRKVEEDVRRKGALDEEEV